MAKQPPAPGTTPKGTIEAFFNLEKETKGALRYQEEGVAPGTEPKIGAFYVRKASGVSAARIKVTIQPS